MDEMNLYDVNGELRILDLDLGERLEFSRARDIRKLIEANIEKLRKISVCASAAQPTDPEIGGRPATAYYLSRDQAIFICLKSETEKAFDIQLEILRVYSAHLDGRSATPIDQQVNAFIAETKEKQAALEQLESRLRYLNQFQPAGCGPELVAGQAQLVQASEELRKSYEQLGRTMAASQVFLYWGRQRRADLTSAGERAAIKVEPFVRF